MSYEYETVYRSSSNGNVLGSDAYSFVSSSSVQAAPVVVDYGVVSSSGSISGVSSGFVGAASSEGELVSRVVSDMVSGSNLSALSQIEQAILRANNPIEINEAEEISVIGQRGIWSNKAEVLNWRGVIPISQYVINEDANPEVIRKRTEQQLIYEQEIAVRYLRPPTPPPPGEILIRQEKNILTPPAPPLVIRQQPPRPETPPPLIIREAPPNPPAAVGQKVVTISGKRLPPPPRKVVIERLAPLPSKPQSVIIERWLPYRDQKRRVIFQKNMVADLVIPAPRNVIVQWEAPAVVIKKEFKDLGVIRANPVEYVERYGASLKSHIDLPQFVKDIPAPSGVILAANHVYASVLELEGDVQALSLIDLDSEGLAAYKSYIRRSSSVQLDGLVAELFASVDRNGDGSLSLSEAEKLLLKLNSRLGRNYGEDQARAFFKALDVNRDGAISFDEFRSAVLRAF